MSSPNTKKILFYVHFNKTNGVDDYVVYQLQQMRPIFDQIIVLSNSKVSSNDKKKFAGLYDTFIQRENTGYDFGAWRDGMSKFGWDKLTTFDELTVMNDTCFGPVHDFAPIYAEMQSRNVDFWGMTVNIALKDILLDKRGNPIFVPTHIQSYYITFNKEVITSKVFKDFWSGIQNFEDVNDVIVNYEIKLTEQLVKGGFTYDTYYNASDDWGMEIISKKEAELSQLFAGDMRKYNPSYTCTRPLWLLTKVKNYPFIKTKAVLMATSQMGDVRQYLIDDTTYPVQLLDSYIGSKYSDLVKIKDEKIVALEHSKTYRFGLFFATIYRKLKVVKVT